MISRCTNPRVEAFKNYGGRGISICERWHSFTNFLADMGEAPDGMTIERIDNDANYEPGNCRWATYAEQRRNSRGTKLTEAGVRLIRDNPSKKLRELADELGVSISTVHLVRKGKIWR